MCILVYCINRKNNDRDRGVAYSCKISKGYIMFLEFEMSKLSDFFESLNDFHVNTYYSRELETGISCQLKR